MHKEYSNIYLTLISIGTQRLLFTTVHFLIAVEAKFHCFIAKKKFRFIWYIKQKSLSVAFTPGKFCYCSDYTNNKFVQQKNKYWNTDPNLCKWNRLKKWYMNVKGYTISKQMGTKARTCNLKRGLSNNNIHNFSKENFSLGIMKKKVTI